MGFFGRLVLVMAVAFFATACAEVEDFDYTPIGDIPPGPGMVSGDEGEFVIYRK